jgi:hypothetical protein
MTKNRLRGGWKATQSSLASLAKEDRFRAHKPPLQRRAAAVEIGPGADNRRARRAAAAARRV